MNRGFVQKKRVLPQPSTLPELLALGLAGLGDVGEHGGALSSLHVPRARLLKERLWLGPTGALAVILTRLTICTNLFKMFLLRKLLSFCVAGDMISSDGET